jgi:hypothetical protein
MSDDIEEVQEINDVQEFEGVEQYQQEEVAPRRFPRWLFYIGGLVVFNVLSYVFDWGWVLW